MAFTDTWYATKGLSLKEIAGFAANKAFEIEKCSPAEIDEIISRMSTGGRWKLLMISGISDYMHAALGDNARTGMSVPRDPSIAC